MTYSQVMISSILIMFGSVFALIFMAFLISKKRNKAAKPVYSQSGRAPVAENKPRSSEPKTYREKLPEPEVRFQTVSDAYHEKRVNEEKRVIRSDRNMKAVRESSYSDPKFRSVRAPRFRVVNTTLLS